MCLHAKMEEVTQLLSCQPTRPVVNGDPRRTKDRRVQVGYTVCYIVAAVIVRDDKVLMVQEAKPSCRGKWYLPAGRMEKGESIVDAVKREVREEAGVHFEPESLIAVEYNASAFVWVRFVFTGRITGGSLKTPAQEDKESIQAQWLPANIDELVHAVPIRAMDCLGPIQIGTKWYGESVGTRCSQLISPTPHLGISLRVLLIYKDTSNGVRYMLVRDKPAGNTSLPGVLCDNHHNMRYEVMDAIQSSGYRLECQVKGIVNIEHDFRGGDGFCVTVLALAITGSNVLEDGCGHHWEPISSQESIGHFDKMINHKCGITQLIDL